ncbi:MAG: hypothetical protein NC203_05560 [Firmicutes bacterium]|nr:hypothetical protein [[Eubacterium] siraeum]MCM1487818.1 hypothetical protein [Bacillota bacterium]
MTTKNTKVKQSQNNTEKKSSKSAKSADKKQKASAAVSVGSAAKKEAVKKTVGRKASDEKKATEKKTQTKKSSAAILPVEAKKPEGMKTSIAEKPSEKIKKQTVEKAKSDIPQTETKNLHEGHRQRVKKRFLKHGLDSFTDVQFMETLLFYGIPKKDTNETAHLLLNTFGSVRKVFAASYEDLVKVNGVGDNAASLIKFFQMGSKKYMELSFEDEDEVLVNNPDKLMDYCQGLFLGMQKEAVYVIALDADLAIISAEQLCSGETDKVWISFRALAKFVYKNNCTRIAITHNHPGGVEMPSRYDMTATEEIAEFLDQIEVELVDHVIVGKGGALSIRKEHSDLHFWKQDYSFIY